MMGNKFSSVDFDTDFFNKNATPANLSSKGAFGTVYGPIKWKEKRLAIKQVMFPGGKSADEIKKDIEDKQQILNSFKHENLMKILSVDLSQLPKVLHIVMEFAAGGSLSEILRSLGSKHIKLPIYVVTDWTKQIAEGMQYLHQKNIVHRDLKPSNILLMEPFDVHNPGKKITLKITDFDEVREYDHTTTMSFVGTCAYMAPEVLLKERFSKASDVWSFGVLIWEMLSGDIPYEGLQASAIISMAIKGELDGLSIAPSFPEDYKLILEKCWKSTCEDRFSFLQILDVLDPAGTEICDLTVLHQEVFILREERQDIEVFDSTEFQFKRRMEVDGMRDPESIASCSVNKCLYTVVLRHHKLFHAILRIDPSNGILIKAWKLTGVLSQLSVASDTNVIVCRDNGSRLYEYTADGKLIRVIDLGRDPVDMTQCINAKHAVKLDNGFFVVCQLYPGEVYLISTKGTSRTSRRIDEVDILKKLSEESVDLIDSSWGPEYLSVDKEGSILVTDGYNDRVILMNSNLGEARILISKKDGMKSAWRTCFNELTGECLVIDGRRIFVWRVKREKIKRQIYDLISYEEAQLTSEEKTPLAETTSDSETIRDLTVFDEEVFIVRYKRKDIEVYDSTTFVFKRRIQVDGMTDTANIASCSVNNYLYTVDLEYQQQFYSMHRIDPSNGNLIKAWKITIVVSQFSVASDTNVIICPGSGSKLYEYTADGELIRVIDLGRDPVDMTQRIRAAYAVKLDNGFFVVCQSDPGEVYLLSTKETSSPSGRIDEVEILNTFSKLGGYLNGSSWSPWYLSVDKEGSILVSDRYYKRAVLINSNFDKARILISEEDGMKSAWRTCFNESTGEWLVTDRRRIFVCRVEEETIERQFHDLISD